MKTATPETIESEIARLAIAQEELMTAGNVKAANKAFDALYRQARLMRSLPDRGLEMLLRLVLHPNRRVRTAAAYLMIPLDESRAIAILRAEAGSGPSWERFTAEMIIKEWEAGRLNVDWFMREPSRR
ncbi:hypothetical protein [Ancylobacter terrae]|uniref:hypothetical protein n=1 Tax=Ancylobacter sp. sgz301288 TaxID=3342077 RepID=UPI00385A5E25